MTPQSKYQSKYQSKSVAENARNFLLDALADGPRWSKDIEREAVEVHGIGLRTLAGVRARLPIRARKEKAVRGRSYLELME